MLAVLDWALGSGIDAVNENIGNKRE